MKEFEKNVSVACRRCTEYDTDVIKQIVIEQFTSLGLEPSFFQGKKTVVKPNLVSAHPPKAAVTTHPAVTQAVCTVLKSWGADVLIAESGGGLFTEATLERFYRITQTADAAKAAGVPLNYDVRCGTLHTPNGETAKSFPCMMPILDADIIVNLPKLKTHTLAMMTAAAKNLFGCVPGLAKVETHARFSDQTVFLSALTDLTEALCREKEVISFCDAVIGMEGNGPSGGDPRPIGYLLSSRNPFALDLLCRDILGLASVPMVECGIRRGLSPASVSDLKIIGDIPDLFSLQGLKMPDTALGDTLTHLPKFLRPRPVIDRSRCVGCGKCAESCPAKTIEIRLMKNQKKQAVIHRSDCLRCFCCQEMCPFRAVKIKKSVVFRFIR